MTGHPRFSTALELRDVASAGGRLRLAYHAQAVTGLGIEQQYLARIELQLEGLAYLWRHVWCQAATDFGLVEGHEHQGVGAGGFGDLHLRANARQAAGFMADQADLLRAHAENHFAVFEPGFVDAQGQFAACLATVQQGDQVAVLALQAQGMKFMGGEPMKLATNRLAGSL